MDDPSTAALDAAFTRPHIPSFRTTMDGRLAVNVKGVPHFTLIKPEKLGTHDKHFFDLTNADVSDGLGTVMSEPHPGNHSPGYLGGTLGLARQQYVEDGSTTTADDWNQIHACIWDDAPPQAGPSGEDIYSVKVLVTARCSSGDCMAAFPPSNESSIRLYMTPVEVTVANAKTESAVITSVLRSGPTVVGPPLDAATLSRPFTGIMFEPTIVHDGRLLICRVGSNDLPQPPGYGSTSGSTMGADIVYSYYSGSTSESVDVMQWVDFYPIAYAHADPNLPSDLGFRQYQLRDATGTLINGNEDLGGSYPWMDREGKNLFFTTLGTTLHHHETPANGEHVPWDTGRYDILVDPDFASTNFGAEEESNTRGVAFAGLWSRGKTVVLDTLHNDMDFAVGNTGGPSPVNPANNPNGLTQPLEADAIGVQQRLAKLFSTGQSSPVTTGPNPGSGYLRLGYGRANNLQLPEDENENTTIIESITHRLNYKKHLERVGRRDVSWIVQNGKHTDQVVFDDFVDPDALVVADMVGLVELPSGHDDPAVTGQNRLVYYDGWDRRPQRTDDAWGTPSNHPLRIQNAATGHHRWELPRFGEIIHSEVMNGGEARVEPTATGGVHGRGLWLKEGIGLRFDVPDLSGSPAVLELAAEGKSLDDQPIYISVFIDPRFGTVNDRRLLTFPDGSFIDIEEGEHLVLGGPSGDELHFVDFPAAVVTGGATDLPSEFPFGQSESWTHVGVRVKDRGHEVTVLLNGIPISRYSNPSRPLFRLHSHLPGSIILGDPQDAGFAGDSFRGWIDEFRVFLHDVDPETACNLAGGTLMGLDLGDTYPDWSNDLAKSYPDWAHEEIDRALLARGETPSSRYFCLHNYERDLPTFRDESTHGLESRGEDIRFPEGPLFYDASRPDSTTNEFCITCHSDNEVLGLGMNALTFLPNAGVASIDGRRQPLQPPAQLFGSIPLNVVDAGPTAGPTTSTSPPPTVINVDQWLQPSYKPAENGVTGAAVVAADSGELLLPLSAGNAVELEPAIHGDGPKSFRGFLASAQGTVVTEHSHLAGAPPYLLTRVSHSASPYTAFKVMGAPFAGRLLDAGAHSFSVTPTGSSSGTFSVVIPQHGSVRTIARFKQDFQPNTPGGKWLYAWMTDDDTGNDSVDPSGIRVLHWDPARDEYNFRGDGAPAPTAPTLGAGRIAGDNDTFPGRKLGLHTEILLAGVRVEAAGYVRVTDVFVDFVNPSAAASAGDGIDMHFMVQQSPTSMTHLASQTMTVAPSNEGAQPPGPILLVSAGDVVWVGIDPRSSAAFDLIDLDFHLKFSETDAGL